jgi:hypothetical protein
VEEQRCWEARCEFELLLLSGLFLFFFAFFLFSPSLLSGLIFSFSGEARLGFL